VWRDLVARAGTRLTLASSLPRLYRAEAAGLDRRQRRPVARAFVRQVLALVGPPLRQTAAAWLEAQPADRRAEWLAAARTADRGPAVERARAALDCLLDALIAGEAP
jgi:hypothetical protein